MMNNDDNDTMFSMWKRNKFDRITSQPKDLSDKQRNDHITFVQEKKKEQGDRTTIGE